MLSRYRAGLRPRLTSTGATASDPLVTKTPPEGRTVPGANCIWRAYGGSAGRHLATHRWPSAWVAVCSSPVATESATTDRAGPRRLLSVQIRIEGGRGAGIRTRDLSVPHAGPKDQVCLEYTACICIPGPGRAITPAVGGSETGEHFALARGKNAAVKRLAVIRAASRRSAETEVRVSSYAAARARCWSWSPSTSTAYCRGRRANSAGASARRHRIPHEYRGAPDISCAVRPT